MAKAPRKPRAGSPEREEHGVEVARKFVAALSEGTAPWQRPWRAGELTAAYNPTTGRPYRGMNQIWLNLQGYSDPRWMTYNQAEAMGAQVLPAAIHGPGTSVEYWKFHDDVAVKDDAGRPVVDANGKPVTQRVELEKPKKFYAKVFNAERIEGLPPLPPREPGNEWERHQRLEAILASSEAAIRHVAGDRAYYSPMKDHIVLPERGQFPTAENYYATALHELGHSTGHPSRLDRDLAHPFGSEGYAKEELVAELYSYMMAQRLGCEFDPSNHHSYVASWIKALENDPREIFRAAAAAEKAMEFVLSRELTQAVELTRPITHEHVLARGLEDDNALAEALALTHQLREASAPHRGLFGPSGLALLEEQAQTDERIAAFRETIVAHSALAMLEERAQADERVMAAFTSLLAFAAGSPAQEKAAALIVRTAIPDQTDRDFIVGGDLATRAGSAELAAWSDELKAMIVAEGPTSAIWERVDTLSLRAIEEANAVKYRTDLAIAAGLTPADGIEAQQLAGRLSVILDAVHYDGRVWSELVPKTRTINDPIPVSKSDYAAIVVEQPDLAQLRDDFVSYAGRSPDHAFMAGALIHDYLAHTVLGDEIRPDSVQSDSVVENRRKALDRHIKLSGLGVVTSDPELGRWLPDTLTAADFRLETAALGLSEREQTAALLLGRDIALAIEGVINDDLPMAAELTTPYEDLLAFAQRGEAQMIAASHVLNLALTVDSDVYGARLRPDWAMASALVEDRINDVRLHLAETELREQQREQEAAGQSNAYAERAAELRNDATLDSEQAHDILDKEFPMPDQAEARLAAERVNLTVPFSAKNAAKAAGAKWDKDEKVWYAPAGADLAKLETWLAPAEQSQAFVKEPHEELADAMVALGLVVDGEPKLDGQWHRVRVDDDPPKGERSGAYRAYDDRNQGGLPAGTIQNHRTGEVITWKYSQIVQAVSPEVKARQEREKAERNAEREAKALAERSALADLVTQLIDQGQPAPADHAYLTRKDIAPQGLVMMEGVVEWPPNFTPTAAEPKPQQLGGKDHLLIPVHDMDGKVWSAQAISPNGKKSFPRGTPKADMQHLIGDVDNERPILFSEGYATGRDLHEGTTYPVAVCFDSGNMERVMQLYRERYPDRLLIAAGDNDHRKEQQTDERTGQPKINVGKTKAIAAAEAVGGQTLLPQFQQDDKGSDWNDLRQLHGKEAQLEQLREGMRAAIRRHQADQLTRTGEGEKRRHERDVRQLERDQEKERGHDDARDLTRGLSHGHREAERGENDHGRGAGLGMSL